ncbi:kinase-like domain-containing protein [Aspergillus pseudonomiae]|nr:kinase-like domain-containing protein [Aspergillus pseudonomiae]
MATKWGEHGIGEDPVKASNYPGKKLCERLSRREGHWSGKGQVNIEFRQNDVVPLEDDQQLEYKGSYGRVCRSILTVDEERIVVARKTMRLSDIPAKKIRDEVKILEDLKHRHLVTFIGSFTSRGFASILMYPFATCDLERLLQGLDEAQYHEQKSPVSTLLSELGWIQTGPKAAPWKPSDIFPHLQRICGCVCSALLYLHQRRIRHKDIKPSNVLVSKDGVYITDFNISKAFKSDLSSHTVGPYAGTMRYSAPECVYETGRSYPSDVYSLGLVFMEIYTYILGRPRSDMNDYTKSDLSLSKDSQIRHAALRILWVRVIFDGAGRGGFGTNAGMQELILRMISENQDARPEAFEVMSELWAHSPSGDFFCNECRKHKGCVGYKGLRKRYSELYKKYKKLEQAREELNASRASNGPLSPSSEVGPTKSPQLTSRSLSQVSVIRSPRTGPPVIRNKSGQRLDLDSLSYSRIVDKRNSDLIDTLNKLLARMEMVVRIRNDLHGCPFADDMHIRDTIPVLSDPLD